jgi:thymidylate synthase (FAD)
MKHIKVNLIGSNGPECVVNGMSKPYKNEKADMALVKKVCLNDNLQERHGTVMEHVVFTFEVLGSSRLELQEHMRHRMASPTVESTRFTLDKVMKEIDESENGFFYVEDYFVIPDLDSEEFAHWDPRLKKTFKMNYLQLCNGSMKLMQDMRKHGASSKKDNDVLKYLLVEGFRTNFTWTINLRSLLNFLRLRNNPAAHFEIRKIAALIIECLKDHWIWPVLEGELQAV